MIVPYSKKYMNEWDDFVLNRSSNGNFLQSRNFLDYHPEGRFRDASIMFVKDSEIAAVIPANEVEDGRVLLSHQGSTFGGLVVGRKYANTLGYNWIFREMIDCFQKRGYERVELKNHSQLYSPDDCFNELFDYYFQLKGFGVRGEIGFFLDLSTLPDNYQNNFEKLRKRKLNKAKRENLWFKKLSDEKEIGTFYEVLQDNMKKFNTVPVHTLSELLNFKQQRLRNVVSFYGVYHGKKMIAGSMVFSFCGKKVFHTQYLASRQDCLELCPNEFLYTALIDEACGLGYHYLSYGTSSLEHGLVYNESLGRFKESFNTDTYMNRCYIWKRNDADA